jgi:hypothetical protein
MREGVSESFSAAMEAGEVAAWQDFYAALPPALARELSLAIHADGPVVYTVCPSIPFIMFNRVINLGMGHTADDEGIDRLMGAYADAGASNYAIHVIPRCQPADLGDRLRGRGFVPSGGWDRIFRDSRPLPGYVPDPVVEKIDDGNAGEWADFLYASYQLPVQPWLRALVGRDGWHHYLLRAEDGAVTAVRSMFVGGDGVTWLGVEAPIPGVTAPSFDDDRRICTRMVADGPALGVTTFVGDIEAPSPDQQGPAYDQFAELGFKRAYLREHFRPGT